MNATKDNFSVARGPLKSITAVTLFLMWLSLVPPAFPADFSARKPLKPSAPAGWTVEERPADWILRPVNASPSEGSFIMITKEQKVIGTLESHFESLWTRIGSPPELSRPRVPSHGTLGNWETMGQAGVISAGGRKRYVVLMALQQADRQFSLRLYTE